MTKTSVKCAKSADVRSRKLTLLSSSNIWELRKNKEDKSAKMYGNTSSLVAKIQRIVKGLSEVYRSVKWSSQNKKQKNIEPVKCGVEV